MNDLSAMLRQHLLEHGADLVGIADLGVLESSVRKGFPFGVAILATFPREVIARNVAGPTPEYAQARRELDQGLAELRQVAARFLIAKGYRADIDLGAVDRSCLRSPLPLKTVATLSGLGWIGRSALLANEQFGSAFRLGAVLTDAPLSADEPITQLRCGSCQTCVDVCPAGAPLGPLWQQKMEREQFFNFAACKETAYRLTRERIVEPNDTIAHCGICLANCPFTKRWVKNTEKF